MLNLKTEFRTALKGIQRSTCMTTQVRANMHVLCSVLGARAPASHRTVRYNISGQHYGNSSICSKHKTSYSTRQDKLENRIMLLNLRINEILREFHGFLLIIFLVEMSWLFLGHIYHANTEYLKFKHMTGSFPNR